MNELNILLAIFLLVTQTSADYREAMRVIIKDEVLGDVTGFRLKEMNILEDCALLCISEGDWCR